MSRNRAAQKGAPSPDWASIPIPDGSTEWGAALAAWRMQQGLTQARLGNALGNSRWIVSMWEAGTKAPREGTRERFEALAKGGPPAALAVAKATLERAFPVEFGPGWYSSKK